jgi:secondary thiamine-phosphate synthase enzyme
VKKALNIVYFTMAIHQETITLSPKSRGFHLITSEIEEALRSMPSIETGILHLFIKHTSASLSINENADPTVREDMEHFFTDIADNKSYYIHTYEGSDDMPAHIKASMLGNSLTIPITHGRMNLGTWQGVYLGEHRDYGGSRRIVITLYG